MKGIDAQSPLGNNSAYPKDADIRTLGEFVAKRSTGIVPKNSPGTLFELYSVPSHAEGYPEILLGSEIGSNKQAVEDGDVLLCKINPRINRTWVVSSQSKNQKIASTEWIRFPRSEAIEPKYLAHYLSQSRFRDFLAANASGVGGSLMRVKPATLKDYPLPIVPRERQKEIIAEIEKQFSRLDEAATNLHRVKANVKRYKAAVLKAAVEGKLTEEWRTENPDVEQACKLLERIFAERRTKWERAELAKMKAKGRVPKDDKWKGKYKEPNVLSHCVADLPSSWVSASIDQLAGVVQYGSSSKTSEDTTGVPVLRMGNIFEGQLELDKLKYLLASHPEFPELLLQAGDFLFNRTNSPELVGKSAVYKGSPSPCSFASYLIRVKFLSGVSPVFVSSFLESLYGRLWVRSVVNQQVGQANVNGTKLKALVIPLPPEQEQHEIETVIDRLFDSINKVAAEVELSIGKVERLRQTVLVETFCGRAGEPIGKRAGQAVA